MKISLAGVINEALMDALPGITAKIAASRTEPDMPLRPDRVSFGRVGADAKPGDRSEDLALTYSHLGRVGFAVSASGPSDSSAQVPRRALDTVLENLRTGATISPQPAADAGISVS